ncbi:CDP-glycerol glycerophosphotransferase family protein [Paracandidimonas soli]|uniref:CDP-glycerol glycerophosphotransferase (TagB/SpsB family) n=1 Tax=Paracandidimonas soli TaxID=1917182 RepID=A0A4R3V4W3_9BURK|nr:CDP-glycerol glycerophosphotransferase family protein [Paracandidimonas soli]TCU98307.1 CDP-glycerol glycerophosphotransferase (TagB/SpsB family) [Paracandidimonas soli]
MLNLFIKKSGALVFHCINFFVSLVFPKSKCLWLYGEWFGNRFDDNSSYAFRAKSEKAIRKVWITKNKKLLEEIVAKGYECYLAYSLYGLYLQARAGVFFCSVNSKDFCFSSINPRCVVIQLWHGLPIKKIGFDVKEERWIKRVLLAIRRHTIDSYDYILSPSSSFDHIFCSAFKVKEDNIIHCAYPRCDGFMVNDDTRDCLRNQLNIDTKYIFFYLPTHRNEGKSGWKIKGLIDDMKRLNGFLQTHDITVIIKPHYYENQNYEEECCGNVKIVKNLPFGLYESLGCSDGLITDYSSVCLDYIFTGNPIFFYMPDLESYLNGDRESYFDLNEIVCAPCADVSSLMREIDFFVKHGKKKEYLRLAINRNFLPGSISGEFQKIAEELINGNQKAK